MATHPAPRLSSARQRRGRQRGVATIVFVLMITVGLAAAAAMVVTATQGAQRLQHAEHTVTQAEMTAWAGVSLLSKAVAKLPADAALTPGQPVVFQGAQAGLSARYVDQRDGLLVFEITGASAGANSILRVALRPAAGGGGPGGEVNLPRGTTLHGNTTLEGSVNYSGTGSPNLHVLDGSLTLQGSVSGLSQVCATGDVSVASDIRVDEVCTNGNATFLGAASVNRVKAIGNVTLSGGAASAIGSVHSNGEVRLSGGSAAAGTVQATRSVYVSGGAARATEVMTEANIDWTSSATATLLSANGTVNYRPSGTNIATDIHARGDVTLTSARNVRTQGATLLVGYYGQGISGRLDGQGLLNGSSWGAWGGAVVGAGTVGSAVTPYPGTVKVTVVPGHTVTVNAVAVPKVPVFGQPKVTVDAYALQTSANFAFTGVDGAGNPRVTVASINGVANGTYYIANNPGVGQNYLCRSTSGQNCVEPLIKVCQGYSNNNKCFSRSGSTWTLEGTTMLPAVLWFEGNLNISNGTWVNSFLATGDISVSGGMKVYSPNYIGSAYACQGLADSARGLPAWASRGLDSNHRATQLCAGTPPVLTGAAAGNLALLAGGYKDGAFVGGNVTLGSSNEIYGAILAGQYLNTGGSTVVGGSVYAAGQGGSTAKTSNRQGGSTTIKTDGGSSAYDPDKPPCMKDCAVPEPEGHNVVWAAPI